MTVRRIGILMEPQESDEAKGVDIRRSIGGEKLVLLDPLLLLDHLHIPPASEETPAVGFPRHPHRGIETLTVVLTGKVHHRDSIGNDDGISGGGAQWMTAGGGIFHEEWLESVPEGVEALQLWFNLPAAKKMIPAAYRAASVGDVPQITLAGGATVRVIAGEYEGTVGPLSGIAVAPACLDVRLPAGASVTFSVAPEETTFAYLYRGDVSFGAEAEAQEVSALKLVIFSDGDEVWSTNTGDKEARFLFVSASPLREPVMQYRSLVMNTVEEMRQAIEDLANGTFERR